MENGKGWTLEVIPEKAETVKLIFQLYTEGEPMPDGAKQDIGASRICRILEAAHVPNPSGGQQWSARTVELMLQNPVYAGKIRWSRRKTKRKMEDGNVQKVRYVSADDTWLIMDGLHEAIIDPATFQQAADKLARRGPVPVQLAGTIKNPFAGIAVCEKCGRVLSLRTHPTYPMLKCPNRFCDNVGTGLAIFEERVIAALAQWLDGYRLEWSGEAAATEDDTATLARYALQQSEAELARLKKQLARTHDLLEQEIYDTETFLDRSRLLSAQIAEAKKGMETAAAALSDAERRAANRASIVPKVEKLLDVYWQLPDAEAKNKMLKGILEKITYRRDKRTGPKGPHDNFEIGLWPKIPSSGE